MKKNLLSIAIILACISLSFAGCGTKPVGSVNEAIEIAKSYATNPEKIDYLVGQAKSMVSSERFQDAVGIAQYILQNLDSESGAAKTILADAQKKIEDLAKAKMEEASKKLSF